MRFWKYVPNAHPAYDPDGPLEGYETARVVTGSMVSERRERRILIGEKIRDEVRKEGIIFSFRDLVEDQKGYAGHTLR